MACIFATFASPVPHSRSVTIVTDPLSQSQKESCSALVNRQEAAICEFHGSGTEFVLHCHIPQMTKVATRRCVPLGPIQKINGTQERPRHKQCENRVVSGAGSSLRRGHQLMFPNQLGSSCFKFSARETPHRSPPKAIICNDAEPQQQFTTGIDLQTL